MRSEPVSVCYQPNSFPLSHTGTTDVTINVICSNVLTCIQTTVRPEADARPERHLPWNPHFPVSHWKLLKRSREICMRIVMEVFVDRSQGNCNRDNEKRGDSSMARPEIRNSRSGIRPEKGGRQAGWWRGWGDGRGSGFDMACYSHFWQRRSESSCMAVLTLTELQGWAVFVFVVVLAVLCFSCVLASLSCNTLCYAECL